MCLMLKNGGFVIVSGDDRTVPVLGYSRTGNIDMEKMPENMKWWLEGYARQIEALRSGQQGLVSSGVRSSKAAIRPMIKTSWHQNEPYNFMCPDYDYVDYDEEGYDADSRCVTGCVATAMAQVMYYWSWPASCPAIDSYPIGHLEGETFVEDHRIKALPATSFNWNLMKTDYGWMETGESAHEVAKLMRYCGQAVGMGYGEGGSSAYLNPSSLVKYFNYSKNLKELMRDHYLTSQWEDIIYEELANNRPVLYGGQSEYGGGHQFIVDGYDGNGLFHMNWGWGSMSGDDYFVLSLADMDNPGRNGKTGWMAYQFDQSALVGVQPDQGEVLQPTLVSYIDDGFESGNYTRENASSDFTNVSLGGFVVYSYTIEPTSERAVQVGWGLYQGDELTVIGSKDASIGTSLNSGIYNGMSVSFGAGLADGKYQLCQIYKFPDATSWTRCYGDNNLVAVVSGTSLTVRLVDTSNMAFTAANVTCSEYPEENSPLTVFAELTNVGESQRLLATLWAKSPGSSEWTYVDSGTFYIDPGRTDEAQFTFTPFEQGTYELKISTNDSEEALATATVSVAATETVVINNVTYLCTPAYQRAKVVQNDDADKEASSVYILQKVTAGGVDCDVKAIGDDAFNYWYMLTSVTIPEGIESIGKQAFIYCNSLSGLVLPSTLKSIGSEAFMDNNSLSTVVSNVAVPFTLPENTFVRWVYDESTGISTLVSSPATLYVPLQTLSGYQAAGWTSQFAKVEEGMPFDYSDGTLKYFCSPGSKTATVIQDESYKTLTSVVIPATITVDEENYKVAIGNMAFYECDNLTSVTIQDGITVIGDRAFEGASQAEFTLPGSLKTIGESAFWNANGLKGLVLPEGLETIGEGAFAFCGQLQTVELPSTLTSIGARAFLGNNNLTAVKSKLASPLAIAESTFAYWDWDNENNKDIFSKTSAVLYVPIGTQEQYQSSTGWNMFAKIEEGFPFEHSDGTLKYSCSPSSKTATVIQDESYKTLTSVVIPATITVNEEDYQVAIGNSAFFRCEGLESVTISDGIKDIGNHAFEGAWGAQFTLSNSLVTIGESAFCNANGITTLILPEGLMSIGEGAFAYCYQLQTVELPSTLTSIGARAFIGNRNLTTVKSKLASPMEISESTFAASSEWDETNNKEIYQPTSAVLYVPDGKKELYESTAGWNMFAKIEQGELKEATVDGLRYSYTTGGTTAIVIKDDSYQSLTSVTIPATVTIDSKPYNVTAISNEAFRDCYQLQSVTLKEGLETIGNYAFRNTGISGISFPGSLNTIGSYAFMHCWNIKTIVVPEGVETVGEQAFYNMGSLTRIELPASLTSLGSYVIGDNSMLIEVISNITDPFLINSNVFGIYHWNEEEESAYFTPSPYTLYVPAGTKSKYQAIQGWTMFASIEEGEPFDYMVGLLKFRCSPDSKKATLIQGDYSELSTVNIPANLNVEGTYYQVKSIGGNAFADCWQLTEVVLPEGLVSIGSQAFSRSAVSSINFPSTLRTIYDNAFWECDGLTSVKLPEGLETIGSFAFAECSNLKSLEIPSTVTSIGSGVIMYDNNLTSVKSNIQAPYAVEYNAFVLKDVWDETSQEYVLTPSPATLYVPSGKKAVYQNTQGWNAFQTIEVTGDADGSGVVDAADIKAVEDYIMGNPPSDFVFGNADVVKDDKINAADLVMIIDIIKNL